MQGLSNAYYHIMALCRYYTNRQCLIVATHCMSVLVSIVITWLLARTKISSGHITVVIIKAVTVND